MQGRRRPVNENQRVAGFCPACGHKSLRLSVVGGAGYITCSRLECPEPNLVTDLLDNRETEHIVTITEEGWTIRHPIRELIDDRFMHCDLHEYMVSIAGPPIVPGRYRVSRDDETWSWYRLDEETDR
jgi:hypothetical protein